MEETLEFYRDRLANFDAERKLCSQYEKMVTPSKADIHSLVWDNEQQRSNALQKEAVIEALDAELFKLTQESIQVAENLSTLQMNQNKRAEQIRRLEDLGQPVQRDTTYIVRDRHGRNIRDHNESLDGYTKPVTKRELRTGEIIQMERKLDETTQQIHAFRRKFELAARDALDVTVQRRDTGAALHSSQLTECERLVSTICRLDHEVFLSMSELLGLRLKIMSAQREEVDEIERLERDRIYFESKEEETKKSLLLEMELMKNRIKVELMTDTRDLQAQLKSLNFQISLMKKKEAMADDADKELDAKTERTKKDLVATKERYESLRRRNALQMEGYENEAAFLRKRLRQLERSLGAGPIPPNVPKRTSSAPSGGQSK